MAVGIDLGTAWLRLATVKDGIVLNDVAASATPNCLAVDGTGLLVGQPALDQLTANPRNTVRGVKRCLGHPFKGCPCVGAVPVVVDRRRDGPLIRTERRDFAPEEVTALLLRRMLLLAEKCTKQPVSEAVITVPAYFSAASRLATIHAGKIAGLQTVHIISDTSAAALAYAAKVKSSRKAVIVDIGAGGGAVSLVEAQKGGHVRVLATSPSRLPGGDDMDLSVVNHFRKVIFKEFNRDVSPADLELLLLRWREAKLHLSSRQTMTTVTASLSGVEFKMMLSLHFYQTDHCKALMAALPSCISAVLKQAKLEPLDVDDVLLLGGCSKLPVVRSTVQGLFPGKELCALVHPEQGVARGAALFAASLLAKECPLEEVVPFKVTYTSGGSARLLCEPGTRLPLLKEVTLLNPDGQPAFLISVEQGSPKRAVVWMTVEGKPLPVSITISIILKADGTLECRGVEHVHVQSCLHDNEILKAKLDTEAFSVEPSTPVEPSVPAEAPLEVPERSPCPQDAHLDSPRPSWTPRALTPSEALHASFEDTRPSPTPASCLSEDTSLPQHSPLPAPSPAPRSFRVPLEEVRCSPTPICPSPAAPPASDSCPVDDNIHPSPTESSPTPERPSSTESSPPFEPPLLQRSESFVLDGSEDREVLVALTRELHAHVFAQDLISRVGVSPLRVNPLDYPNPALVQFFVLQEDVALECLAHSRLQTVMEEVQASGRFCVMLDTTITPEKNFVSLMLRYCLASGDVVERLIALFDEEQASGDHLFQRLTTCCEQHNVDWEQSLCGVSMDSCNVTAKAYERLVSLLKERAPHLRLVWNGAHSVSDLVAQSCGDSEWGRRFFGTLETLREFFSVEKRSSVLAMHCPTTPMDSLEDVVQFVHQNFDGVIRALTPLCSTEWKTAFVARCLLSSLQAPEFKTHLGLLVDIFRATAPLASMLQLTSELHEDVDVAREVETAFASLSKISQQTRSDTAAVQRIGTTLELRLRDSLCVLRDIALLSRAFSASPRGLTKSQLFDWVPGLQRRHLNIEFSSAQVEFREKSRQPSLVINRLMMSRNFCGKLYPNLFKGLQELCTLPLLPAVGETRKLHLLQRCLSAWKNRTALEAKMLLLCSAGPAPVDGLNYKVAVNLLLDRCTF